MPELPEVETVRRELEPWLKGRTILRAERLDAPEGPKYARLECAAGQRIEAVNRRGKFLLLPLSEGDELIIHLGMTGIISPHKPEKHLRVKLELSKGENPELYFQDVRRFGRFLVLKQGDYRDLPTLFAMGPEPLSDSFHSQQFAKALSQSSAPIKVYLLSQKPVSGIGNIYADEVLWASKIHPLMPAKEVAKRQIPLLVQAIKEVLLAAIAAQGTTLNDYRTVNGELGAYREALKAYGHQEEPCLRCGTPITKVVLAGRGTHFCPKCQKMPKSKAAKRLSYTC